MTAAIHVLTVGGEVSIPARSDLLVLACETPVAQNYSDAVSSPVALVISVLRAVWTARTESRTTIDRLAVVLVDRGAAVPEFAESLFESLRGVCGSLTLELSPQGMNINLVRSRSLEHSQDILNHLAAKRAAFVAGSTLDLFQEESR